jgi:hypothetical protein
LVVFRYNGLDTPPEFFSFKISIGHIWECQSAKSRFAFQFLNFLEPTTKKLDVSFFANLHGVFLLSLSWVKENGTNVNHELVKEGWCWWYRKYAPGNGELEKLEKDAREAKKGLWADPAPVPPWVFRKTKRGQTLDPAAVEHC